MVTFAVLASLMVVGALGVVLLRQPVHAALSLVGTLLALAVAYLLLEATFLAAVQVIVYAGAIMVLFLFVLMLLNVQAGEDYSPSLRGLRWVAYATAVVVAAAVALVAFWNGRPAPDLAVVQANLQGGSAAGIADVLFADLLLAFHLVGVLLLTGVIGAVALVQRRATTAHGAPKGSPELPVGRAALNSGSEGVAR
jgi:NADH-quinone oxidoreductase subunit J